jgi:hypothetical protein
MYSVLSNGRRAAKNVSKVKEKRTAGTGAGLAGREGCLNGGGGGTVIFKKKKGGVG